MSDDTGEPGSKRMQQSVLAPLEKRALLWLAARMPTGVNSDHLTALGLFAMLGAGLCYVRADGAPGWLHAASACLVVNWFGDSLDGTLARFRQCQRPRYGYYVDHMVDAFGTLSLIGGLGLSGYMDSSLALLLLIAYFLMSIQTYLATNVFKVFQISFWKISPTEIRLGMIAANTWVVAHPTVALPGGEWRFFDIVAVASITGMLLILLVTTSRNTVRLYREERP